jgi:hypothetical protein
MLIHHFVNGKHSYTTISVPASNSKMSVIIDCDASQHFACSRHSKNHKAKATSRNRFGNSRRLNVSHSKDAQSAVYTGSNET